MRENFLNLCYLLCLVISQPTYPAFPVLCAGFKYNIHSDTDRFSLEENDHACVEAHILISELKQKNWSLGLEVGRHAPSSTHVSMYLCPAPGSTRQGRATEGSGSPNPRPLLPLPHNNPLQVLEIIPTLTLSQDLLLILFWAESKVREENSISMNILLRNSTFI